MICVPFCVICIVERLVSSVICRFQGLSYLHVPDCIRVSFILLIHHMILLILIFVLSVTFWTLTCYKIWILLIIYCFIWNYWIIYFVTCLEVFWGLWVNSYQLAVHSRESCMREQALLPHWLCNQNTHQGICSCSPIVNFFKFTFHHGMATSVIFLIKN